MLRGEVWLISLDPTVGAEIRKTRPAMIVSEDAIGVLPLRVVVPLTEWKERYCLDRDVRHQKQKHQHRQSERNRYRYAGQHEREQQRKDNAGIAEEADRDQCAGNSDQPDTGPRFRHWR